MDDTGTHRYDPIRVYTTADTDTDTSTPCVGVPATCNIRPGRSLRERSLYAMGGPCTCVLSQFYDWLTWRNVRVIDSWLLLSLPAGGGSAAWWWPRPVLRGLCVTGMPVSGYSLLLHPSPPTLSRIMDHKTAHTRACAAGGWRVA